MTTPTRYRIAGDVYYITTVVQERLKVFTRPSLIIPLLDSLNFYRYRYDFKLLGYVVVPDHLHMLIWPQAEPRLSDMMRDYKSFTSGRISRQVELEGQDNWLHEFEVTGQTGSRSERKVWQDSFWEQTLYSDTFVRQKLDYLHRNPVRSGLVGQPADYPYSSHRNYVTGDSSLIEIDAGWT